MEIFKIELVDNFKFIISANWLGILLIGFFLFVVINGIKFLSKHLFMKSISFSEATIGIGTGSVKITYDKKIQEIAYKIWIELKTRKIGMMFDEENDVIVEVYNSWYQAFGIIRELLEEVPVEKIKYASGLIDITTKVLNEGLRPHLTTWQAKYRKWYENTIKEANSTKTPQEIQKEYPLYEDLIKDLKKTNGIMIHFADELDKIVRDER